MISPDSDLPPGAQRDVLSGKTKTWPYGTRKIVKVAEARIPATRAFAAVKAALRPEFRDVECCIVTEVHDPRIGHLLLGTDHLVPPVKDKTYIMEFTKGGPLDGYWRLISETIPT